MGKVKQHAEQEAIKDLEEAKEDLIWFSKQLINAEKDFKMAVNNVENAKQQYRKIFG